MQVATTLELDAPVAALGILWSRAVLARYQDARERGLAHAQALAEAGGLLCVFQPSLSPGEAQEHAAKLVSDALSRPSA